MRAALNAQMALVHANKSEQSDGYYDSILLYHSLLLMELSNITGKNLNLKKNK